MKVFQRFTKTPYRTHGSPTDSDLFYINYGTYSDMIQYELPNLGSVSGYYSDATDTYNQSDLSGVCEGGTCQTALDFQINNVEMYVTNEEDLENTGNILVIYIGFYHPDFGTKYAIDIVAPLNYQASISESGKKIPIQASDPDAWDKVYYPSPAPGT